MREARVDPVAIGANFALLAQRHSPLGVIAVVSGDAYGHGAVDSARAAVAAGAEWLGTARLEDAIVLREAGLTVPILAWQHSPNEDFIAAVAADITPAVSTSQALAAAVAAGAESLHLVLETGAGLPGLDHEEWPSAVREAVSLQRSGRLGPLGIMVTIGPGWADAVAKGLALVATEGVDVRMVHGNAVSSGSDAASLPAGMLTAVRSGAELFGLSESAESAVAAGFVPAMKLWAPIIGTKTVEGGAGVSYGYTYRTSAESNLALVPLGYGDGLDRSAGNRAPAWIGGQVYRISGRVAMDAFVVDLGDDAAAVGEDAVLFGDPAQGFPSAEDWAIALETTSAVIVTRLTKRVRRFWS